MIPEVALRLRPANCCNRFAIGVFRPDRGNHKPAQGNALGCETTVTVALKGRNTESAISDVSPCQGLQFNNKPDAQGDALGWYV